MNYDFFKFSDTSTLTYSFNFIVKRAKKYEIT